MGIKSNPRARARVPEHLKHYLEETILISEWYPEDAYHELITILVDETPADAVGGNVWRFFGQISAQRDIAGEQKLVSQAARIRTAGVYRGYGGEQLDIADVLLRSARLWRVYHDTGDMTCYRRSGNDFVVYHELVGFHFPHIGMAELMGAYTVEFARLLGHEIQSAVEHLGTNDRDPTLWSARCEHTETNRNALARVPLRDD